MKPALGDVNQALRYLPVILTVVLFHTSPALGYPARRERPLRGLVLVQLPLALCL
jgi:hypothetical protein